ncbi:MAG: Arc family DNA-binding protein [Devosia sp.]
MARNDPQINLRLPPELKERLETAATVMHRPFKAEVVARLEDSFAIDDYDDFPGWGRGESASNMLQELQAVKARNDELFDLTTSQHKTMSLQAQVLQEQSGVIRQQAEALQTLRTQDARTDPVEPGVDMLKRSLSVDIETVNAVVDALRSGNVEAALNALGEVMPTRPKVKAE